MSTYSRSSIQTRTIQGNLNFLNGGANKSIDSGDRLHVQLLLRSRRATNQYLESHCKKGTARPHDIPFRCTSGSWVGTAISRDYEPRWKNGYVSRLLSPYCNVDGRYVNGGIDHQASQRLHAALLKHEHVVLGGDKRLFKRELRWT